MDDVPERIVRSLALIHQRRAAATISRIRTVPYHFFEYRGYRCGVIRCVRANTIWCGFVESPVDELQWPNPQRRPFIVGVDFEIPVEGTNIVIRGFHLAHLLHDSTFYGVYKRRGSDYVAHHLRSYIDECLDYRDDDETVLAE